MSPREPSAPGVFRSRSDGDSFCSCLWGFVWIAPAWREPRFLYALAAWDLVVFALWAWDLSRMAKPEQIEVRRVWNEPLGLSKRMPVTHRAAQFLERSDFRQRHRRSSRNFLPRSAHCRNGGARKRRAQRFVSDRASLSRRRALRRMSGCATRARLRLAERWARAQLPQTVRVYPNIEEAQRMRIYLIRSRQIELEKRLKRQRGHGREFESLRDYREGDEFRDICWSVTARRGKLITKVHQIERSQTIWLVLDAGRLLRARVDRLTKLDYTVSAALSLAQVAFYSGDRVALLAYGRKPQQRVGPGRGVSHLRVLMESMSQVRAEAFEADHLLAAESLLSQQSRRSLIVWLTDLAETAATPEVIECAAKMATRHLVLLGIIGQPELRRLVAAGPPDASGMYRYTAALEVVQRRELLLRRLRQQGALTMEVDASRMSTALVNRYLEVKERSLL